MTDVYVLFARKDDWYEAEVIQAVFSSFDSMMAHVYETFEFWGTPIEFYESQKLTCFRGSCHFKDSNNLDRYFLSYYKGPVL